MMKKVSTVLAAGLLATAANAGVVATYGFTDLAGSYDSATGIFRAVATDNANYATSGDVTKIGAPTATAEYAFGFTSRSGFANAVFEIAVTMNNGLTAMGSGSFTITDDDGDTITGLISGMWINGGSGYVYFNGSMSGVTFNDNGAADSSFDGPDGGGFSFPLTQLNNEVGAIVGLFIKPGTFFGGSFRDRPTQIDGQILPTPGSLALVGISGLALARRRR
ncbi:MAG: hypothetical protein KF902_11425 [Phycisphaeraceae bacterium]|nr:hypothetical protein [Phycisphaeraceae bacterium]MBX3361816.1 hypothetical protein [Phycisphaeraceae bacterium]MBX3367511.1 hypothetical protein [Phycisphaeraceae bacterium]MCW5767383.1 hypothetical protein [Phycisphaeraceae bacterium]QYK47012.1 MAG: hypothetical protein KF838_09465 [Phycisphaeraceae bacterium]